MFDLTIGWFARATFLIFLCVMIALGSVFVSYYVLLTMLYFELIYCELWVYINFGFTYLKMSDTVSAKY